MKIKTIKKDGDLSIIQVIDNKIKTVVEDDKNNKSLVIQYNDGWKINVIGGEN